MTNQLADDLRLGIGGNFPPLGEQLAEEILPLSLRVAQLLDVCGTAAIIDDESAAKVIDLAGLMDALEKELDAAREARGRPFLDAMRAVNGAYNPLIEDLTTARLGLLGTDKKRRGGLRGMLDAFRQKREAEAEEARQAALAEQRRREEEAAAAAERARATTNVGDALASLKAQEEATAAARRAEAIRAEPVRAQLGSLGRRREIAYDITDLRKLLGWILRQPMRSNLEAETRKLMGAYLRQLGVDAVTRGIEIPGLLAWVETSAAIRR